MVKLVELDELPEVTQELLILSSSPPPQSSEAVLDPQNDRERSEDRPRTPGQTGLHAALDPEREQAVLATPPASPSRHVEVKDYADDQPGFQGQVESEDQSQLEREQVVPAKREELPPSPATSPTRKAEPAVGLANDQAASESRPATLDQIVSEDKPQSAKAQIEPVENRIIRRSTKMGDMDVALGNVPDELYQYTARILSDWIATYKDQRLMVKIIWMALDEILKAGFEPSMAQQIVWNLLVAMKNEGRITKEGQITLKPIEGFKDDPRSGRAVGNPRGNMAMNDRGPYLTNSGIVGYQGAHRPSPYHMPAPPPAMASYARPTVLGHPVNNLGLEPALWLQHEGQLVPFYGPKRQIGSPYGPMPDNVGPEFKRIRPAHNEPLPPQSPRHIANLPVRQPVNVPRQRLQPQIHEQTPASLQAAKDFIRELGNPALQQHRNVPPAQSTNVPQPQSPPQASMRADDAGVQKTANVPLQQPKPYIPRGPRKAPARQQAQPLQTLLHESNDTDAPIYLAASPLPSVQGNMVSTPIGAPPSVHQPLDSHDLSQKWRCIDVISPEPGWELFNPFPEHKIEEIIRHQLPHLKGGVHAYIRNVLCKVDDPIAEIMALIERIHGHKGEIWGIQPEHFREAWDAIKLREQHDAEFLHYKKFGCQMCLWKRARCEMANPDHPDGKPCQRCGQFGSVCRRPVGSGLPKCMPPKWTAVEVDVISIDD